MKSSRWSRRSAMTRAGLAALALSSGLLLGQASCGVCGEGLTNCGGQCVDTALDPRHCGACGTTCPDGQSCQQGACALRCAGGASLCGERCVELSHDPEHCGACGKVCGEAEICDEGVCVSFCQGGAKPCGEHCVDLQNDPFHCGACDKACSLPRSCSEGKCICPPDTLSCSDGCVQVLTDVKHCGGCDTVCDAAKKEICKDGVCQVVCAGGSEACGKQCVDTLNDPENCGGCGMHCPLDQLCLGGECSLNCSGKTKECTAGKCSDLTIDPENCSFCGHDCPDGFICDDSICQLECVGGTTKCDGKCVNTKNDHDHCGVCGFACPVDQICANGGCVLSCPAGTMKCGGSCFDPKVDPKNCGGCNKKCDPGQDCVDSMCVGKAPACGNLACEAGASAFVFAGGTSVPIPDNNTFINNTLSVPVSGVVKRAVVQIFVKHPFDADLDIELKSPGATTVDLSSDNGGNGDDYAATTFDSLCPSSVTGASAPFAGNFAPEQSLLAFTGAQAQGSWTLRVRDDASQDTGTLVWWHLYLCIK